MDIREELEEVLNHEELLWKKKVKLEQSDINFLGKEVTNEEIKMTLFDMAPLKALESDGYHAIFFQNQWDSIGGTIYEWVKRVFKGKLLIKN
ncbi:hypothetical protein PVK06_019819 [Gossypium arboreum]|uniref:Uncharacterized protein n=1 Tax=Gossypium arboreum TaxID=29729 RepID=A0ABR0PKU5_GOSAR|nr:hypothetical protein PVK06_019819 [Gossypium arboreum]